MAWCDGVLEVAWAQISPGGTSLSLSTPMVSDLRHTASALGRPATVGVEVRRRGRPFAPSSAKTMCRRGTTAGHSPETAFFNYSFSILGLEKSYSRSKADATPPIMPTLGNYGLNLVMYSSKLDFNTFF